jgi:hypothetical protein
MLNKRFYLVSASVCWLVVIISCVALLSGCGGTQVPIATPVDKSLVLVIQYENLEETYKSQYRFSTPEQQAWLRYHVAPQLDRLRAAVIVYADIVIAGDDATAQRLVVLDLLREVTLNMARSQDESS